jgi:cyclopropane fatty-acyl-phospholipid synthase-like methyltransferase
MTPSPSVSPVVERYDALIFDSVLRGYYGGTGFYNVGLWAEGTPDQAGASRALVDRLLTHVAVGASAILDVGCGLGATTAQIAARRPSAAVTGVNVSPRQLQACRETAPSCRFELMDAARMTFADRSFDAVVCVEAAFHFDTRADFLREAGRVLRPGGTLTMSDMLFAGPDWAGAWTVPGANHVAGVAAYRALLADAGFDVVECDDVVGSWDEWCRRLGAWIEKRHRDGEVDAETHRLWSTVVGRLSIGTLEHLLIVAARRPG